MNAFEFADKYCQPYSINGQKITPRYCPVCHGGQNRDANTCSIYPDETGRWVYRCQRAGCPDGKGTFAHLTQLFNENADMQTNGAPSFQSRMQKRNYVLPDTSALTAPTEEIYQYFSLRKISRDTVDTFRIKADKDGNIVFPFYEDGKIVYVKYRKPQKFVKGSGPKEWQEANTKPILFGLDLTSYSQPLIITEGQMDAMSLYEAGLRNVVSVPCGAQNELWVDNNADELDKYPSIILFGDSDAPGQSAVQSWAHRLGEGKCSIVGNYPKRTDNEDVYCKDANEILYFYGAEKLKEMVDEATEVTMEGLVDLSTIPLFNPRVTKMIPSSFYSINYELGGYSPGDLVVWTGRTGAGKSTVVTQEVLASVESGENICYYTAEFSPMKLKRSLYLQAAGSEFVGLEYDPRRDREIQTISPEVCSRIDDWLAGRIMLCTDNVATMKFSSEYLVELLKYARKRNGCTVAVVDNIMTAVMGADDDQYFRAQEKFTLELKKIASSLGMVVHLVCHPRKTKDRLSNDDVSGSASITRLADTVISVSHGTISVLKNRNEGTTDTEAKFVYYPDCRICADVDHNVPLHCSWDRTNIEHPKRLASEVYRPIYPDLGGYPI